MSVLASQVRRLSFCCYRSLRRPKSAFTLARNCNDERRTIVHWLRIRCVCNSSLSDVLQTGLRNASTVRWKKLPIAGTRPPIVCGDDTLWRLRWFWSRSTIWYGIGMLSAGHLQTRGLPRYYATRSVTIIGLIPRLRCVIRHVELASGSLGEMSCQIR